MQMGVDSYGLVTSQGARQPPLILTRRPNNLRPRTINQRSVSLLQAHHPHQKPNVATSRSCFVIWSILPPSHRNLTLRTCETWSVRINRCAQTSSSVLTDMWPNSLVMDCWSILAIHTPMKMTPNELYALAWVFSLPCGSCIPICNTAT